MCLHSDKCIKREFRVKPSGPALWRGTPEATEPPSEHAFPILLSLIPTLKGKVLIHSSYLLDTTTFQLYTANIFSHWVYLFTVFRASFGNIKFLILMQSNLSVFSFSAFISCSRNLSQPWGNNDILLYYLLSFYKLYRLAFHIQVIIPPEADVYSFQKWNTGSEFIFILWIPSCSRMDYWKSCPFLSDQRSSIHTRMSLMWALSSVLLVYLHIPVPMTHILVTTVL